MFLFQTFQVFNRRLWPCHATLIFQYTRFFQMYISNQSASMLSCTTVSLFGFWNCDIKANIFPVALLCSSWPGVKHLPPVFPWHLPVPQLSAGLCSWCSNDRILSAVSFFWCRITQSPARSLQQPHNSLLSPLSCPQGLCACLPPHSSAGATINIQLLMAAELQYVLLSLQSGLSLL